MGKILKNVISEEINIALAILKRKAAIQEAPLPTDLPDPDSDPMADPMSDPMADLGADPMADPSASPEGETPPEEEVPDEQEEEEAKGPVDSTFDELEELIKKTEDIPKVIKMLKANVQSKFEGLHDPALAELVNKINNEGSLAAKVALNTRPELADLKTLIQSPTEEVINTGDVMKIRESELKKLASKIAEVKFQKLTENTNLTAQRRLVSMAEQMVMEFEADIIKEFNIVNPDNMDPEVQHAYINIVGAMQKKISTAVVEALDKLQAFPRAVEAAAQTQSK